MENSEQISIRVYVRISLYPIIVQLKSCIGNQIIFAIIQINNTLWKHLCSSCLGNFFNNNLKELQTIQNQFLRIMAVKASFRPTEISQIHNGTGISKISDWITSYERHLLARGLNILFVYYSL